MYIRAFTLNIWQKITDAITYTSKETNAGQKHLPFSIPKKWSKKKPSIKNTIILVSFMHTLRKNISLHLQA